MRFDENGNYTKSDRNERKFIEKINAQKYLHAAQLVILAGVVALIVLNFSKITSTLGKIFGVLTPLILGMIIAFVLNIPMVFIEKNYFPKNKSQWVIKSRRIVSLLLSLIIVLGVVIGTITLIIPQISNAAKIIIDKTPELYENVSVFVGEKLKSNSYLAQRWDAFSQNSEQMMQNIFEKSGDIVGGVFNVTKTALGGVVTFIFGLMFAVYMLLSKEKLLEQTVSVSKAYFSVVRREKISRILNVANTTFSGYITGQMIEALVIGIIATVAMMILGFPFPTMIGSITGLTTFVPIVGAYSGGLIGFLMILTVDPVKAMFFIVFIVVLQQVDGNFIYPRIVGNSVGMPALWVLIAVLIGGGLFGFTGALLGVPTLATLYKLLKIDVHSKLSEKENNRASGLVAMKVQRNLTKDEERELEIKEEQLNLENEAEIKEEIDEKIKEEKKEQKEVQKEIENN